MREQTDYSFTLEKRIVLFRKYLIKKLFHYMKDNPNTGFCLHCLEITSFSSQAIKIYKTIHLTNLIKSAFCRYTLYNTTCGKGKGESALLLLTSQKKSNQNTLLFFLIPAEQTLAMPAQVGVTVLWVLQSTFTSLVFKMVD